MDLAREIHIYHQLSTHHHPQVEAFDITKRFTQLQKRYSYLEVIYFSKHSGLHHLQSEAYKLTPPNLNHKS